MRDLPFPQEIRDAFEDPEPEENTQDLRGLANSVYGSRLEAVLSAKKDRTLRQMLQTDPEHSTRMAVFQGRFAAYEEIIGLIRESYISDSEESEDA